MSDEQKCSQCGKTIKVQIMQNTGVCGENCRKKRDGEGTHQTALVDAGITNILNQPTGEVNLKEIR